MEVNIGAGAPLREATLCFLVKGKSACQVLLGYKKAGFGRGKYAGFGGKVKPGESFAAAARREMEEESGVVVSEDHLEYAGCLSFLFPARPEWSQRVHVFLAQSWTGDPVESDEMAPSWFNVQNLPFEQMWQDDADWLPLILAGRRIEARFIFREDNESVQAVEIAGLGEIIRSENGLANAVEAGISYFHLL